MENQLDQDAYNLAKAIRKTETSGSANPYTQKGASGEFGAYQFMPTTYKNLAKKHLGDENALPTVENQNRIAYSEIKALKDAGKTPAQIASIWNSGKADAYKTATTGVNSMGVKYDVPDYVAKVSRNYRELKSQNSQSVLPSEEIKVNTEQPKTITQKVGGFLDMLLGGGKIGEAIGTAQAKQQALSGEGVVEADYSKLSPRAIAKLQAQGVPTSAEAQRQETASQIQGPTAGQVAGDVGRVALNFLPVGKIAGGATTALKAVPLLGKVAKPLANIATGAAVGATGQALSNVSEGQAPQGGTGALIGGGIASIPYVGKGLAKAGSEVLGASTGTGAGVIKEFTKAISKGGETAKIAREAMRGNLNPQEIVDEARTAFGQVIKNRSDEYTKNLSTLKTKTNIIDHKPIIEKFNKQLEEFGVFSNSDGTPNFSRSPGLGRYEKDLKALSSTLAEWGSQTGDNTIAGIDKLKQVIDDFRIGSADSKKFDTFVTSLRGEAKNIIKKDLIKSKDLKTYNQYEKMLNDYEKSTKDIKEIQKALSLGDKASIDTAFRKLSTVLRTNNEIRKQAIQQLDEITDGQLLPKIAGQQMNELLPRGIMRPLATAAAGVGGLSGVGIIPMLKVALLTSPRVVGEILNVLGIASSKTRLVKDALLKGSTSVFPGDVIMDKLNK